MKMGKVGSALFTGLAGLAILACSSSDGSAANAAKAEAQAEDAFLEQYCEIVLPCCNRVLQLPLNDVAGCKTHIQTIDPETYKNAQARTDCITQAKAAAPKPDFCSDFQAMDIPSCPDASRGKTLGTKKAGEVCTSVADCAPDYTGVVDCAAGVCQLRKRGKEGDGPCDRTIDTSATEGPVVTASPNAATGGTVYDCFVTLDGLQCDSVTQKCAKPLAEKGPTCGASSECASDHYCDSDSRQCYPKLTVQSKCDTDDECQGHCDQDTGGFCVAYADVNGDCSDTSWCKHGLECDSGKCVAPAPDQRLASTCH